MITRLNNKFRYKNMSIKTILMISFIFVAIVPILLATTSTYFKSSKIINENASQYTTQMLEQTNREINVKMEHITTYSDALLVNPLIQGIQDYTLPSKEVSYLYRLQLQKQLNQFVISSGVVEYASLYDHKGELITMTNVFPQPDLDASTRAEINELNGRPLWSFSGKSISYSGEYLISAQRMIKDLNGPSMAAIGYLMFEIKEKILYESIKDLQLGESGYAVIIDQAGNILSSQQRERIGETLNSKIFHGIKDINEGSINQRIEGKDYFVTFHTSAPTGWKIVGIISQSEMTPGLLEVLQLNVVISIFWVILSIMLAILITNSVANPINNLIKMMRHVEHGNFSVIVDINQNKEITILSKSFNNMVSKLNELISRVYEQEIKQKHAEFKALQAQINPHFLYNTLDTVYWMLYVKGEENIGDIVISLSSMLRYSIANEGSFVTIEMEVQNLHHYIKIQSARYHERIQFRVDIDPQILKAKTIKFLIQPIVENAITHGIEPVERMGEIGIDMFKEAAQIFIVISDNGVGMTPQKRKTIFNSDSSGKGLGLLNVHERIQHIFGPAFGLNVYSEVGKGTTVCIILPLNFATNGKDENHEDPAR